MIITNQQLFCIVVRHTTILWQLLKNILLIEENTKVGPVMLRIVSYLVGKLTSRRYSVYRLLSFYKNDYVNTSMGETGLEGGGGKVKVVVVKAD